jgi:hypothetical protein
MPRTKHIRTKGFRPGDLLWKGAGTKRVLVLDDRMPAMKETVYRVCPLGFTGNQKLVTPEELEVLGYWKCGRKNEVEESLERGRKRKKKKVYGVDKAQDKINRLKKRFNRHKRRKGR